MDAEGCYNGMAEGEPEMDAGEGTRSGRSSQKWMLGPEVDARARSGCLGQNWMPGERKD